MAYQGAGRDLGTDAVRNINEWATSGLQPDLTVLLDVDPAVGRRRTAGDAAEDRLESEADEFHAGSGPRSWTSPRPARTPTWCCAAHLPVGRTGGADPRAASRRPCWFPPAGGGPMTVWDDLQGQPAVVAQLRQAASRATA